MGKKFDSAEKIGYNETMSRKSPEISVSQAQNNESKTLRFLPGLNDEHRELQEKLKKMQQDILESE